MPRAGPTSEVIRRAVTSQIVTALGLHDRVRPRRNSAGRAHPDREGRAQAALHYVRLAMYGRRGHRSVVEAAERSRKARHSADQDTYIFRSVRRVQSGGCGRHGERRGGHLHRPWRVSRQARRVRVPGRRWPWSARISPPRQELGHTECARHLLDSRRARLELATIVARGDYGDSQARLAGLGGSTPTGISRRACSPSSASADSIQRLRADLSKLRARKRLAGLELAARRSRRSTRSWPRRSRTRGPSRISRARSASSRGRRCRPTRSTRSVEVRPRGGAQARLGLLLAFLRGSGLASAAW
jgi:hypothetical protein